MGAYAITRAECCTDFSSQDLNRRLGPDLRHLLESLSPEVDDASFISIDGKGVDIRVRQGAQVSRYGSDHLPLTSNRSVV